jgi:hypothetical protein
MENFSLKRLNNVEAREEYQGKILKRFAVLQNLNNDVDISSSGKPQRQYESVSQMQSVAVN